VIITTTLIIILFTTLVFGGLTMPIVRYVQGTSRKSSRVRLRNRNRRRSKEITLSKTREMGQTIDSEHLSELTEEEFDFSLARQNGFVKLDNKYFRPFFTRRFTQQELKDCQSQMTDLTNSWYQNVRVSPINSDDEDSHEHELDGDMNRLHDRFAMQWTLSLWSSCSTTTVVLHKLKSDISLPTDNGNLRIFLKNNAK